MPKVVSRINQAPNVMRTAAAELSKRAAESHVAVSRQLAPVSDNDDPGHVHLRDRIHAEQKGYATWEVISEAEYSAYVEFEQPFFLPGYESAQRQLRDESQQVIAANLVKLSVGVA